jgi:DNA repair protein RadC
MNKHRKSSVFNDAQTQAPYPDLPRERLLRLGPQALSTQELLALLINTGQQGNPALAIAAALLDRFPSLADIAARDVSELRGVLGLGTAKASLVKAALELATRMQAEPYSGKYAITGPESLAKRMAPLLQHQRTELFYVLLLNTANLVIRDVLVGKGSLNSVSIHPREVFRLAISECAASILLVHNHPSGNAEPSADDVAITKQLVAAGRIVDINVLDHVIIAGNSYTSLAERNLM